MISGANRSVPPFRVSLRTHQIQDAIPVIVLREIQFARPEQKIAPIKQNSGLHWTTAHFPLKVFKVEVLLLSLRYWCRVYSIFISPNDAALICQMNVFHSKWPCKVCLELQIANFSNAQSVFFHVLCACLLFHKDRITPARRYKKFHLVFIFLIVYKSHEKTKNNNVLVSLSKLSDCLWPQAHSFLLSM